MNFGVVKRKGARAGLAGALGGAIAGETPRASLAAAGAGVVVLGVTTSGAAGVSAVRMSAFGAGAAGLAGAGSPAADRRACRSGHRGSARTRRKSSFVA